MIAPSPEVDAWTHHYQRIVRASCHCIVLAGELERSEEPKRGQLMRHLCASAGNCFLGPVKQNTITPARKQPASSELTWTIPISILPFWGCDECGIVIAIEQKRMREDHLALGSLRRRRTRFKLCRMTPLRSTNLLLDVGPVHEEKGWQISWIADVISLREPIVSLAARSPPHPSESPSPSPNLNRAFTSETD